MLESVPLAATAGLEIVRATVDDAGRLVDFLAGFDEVSLLEWQGVEFSERVLSHPTTISLCAQSKGGAIVGALIGGVLGTRGTINHVARRRRDRDDAAQCPRRRERGRLHRGIRRLRDRNMAEETRLILIVASMATVTCLARALPLHLDVSRWPPFVRDALESCRLRS